MTVRICATNSTLLGKMQPFCTFKNVTLSLTLHYFSRPQNSVWHVCRKSTRLHWSPPPRVQIYFSPRNHKHDGPILIIRLTRCTNFSNLFLEQNSTCFGQFLCPSSAVFHCTHSNGICHTGLVTACEQDQDGTAVPSWSCRVLFQK